MDVSAFLPPPNDTSSPPPSSPLAVPRKREQQPLKDAHENSGFGAKAYVSKGNDVPYLLMSGPREGEKRIESTSGSLCIRGRDTAEDSFSDYENMSELGNLSDLSDFTPMPRLDPRNKHPILEMGVKRAKNNNASQAGDEEKQKSYTKNEWPSLEEKRRKRLRLPAPRSVRKAWSSEDPMESERIRREILDMRDYCYHESTSQDDCDSSSSSVNHHQRGGHSLQTIRLNPRSLAASHCTSGVAKTRNARGTMMRSNGSLGLLTTPLNNPDDDSSEEAAALSHWCACLQESLQRDEGSDETIDVKDALCGWRLRPHQQEGVSFLWDNCFLSTALARSGHHGWGCILSHVCGLGKTAQALSFSAAVMTDSVALADHALIVVPINTAANWRRECDRWLEREIPRYSLRKSTNSSHASFDVLSAWEATGGVLIAGYERFRELVTGKKRATERSKALLTKLPDLLILDEAHTLRAGDSGLLTALKLVHTRRRVLLTGTPLQNRLDEYYNVIEFARPGYLGDTKSFEKLFTKYIQPRIKNSKKKKTAGRGGGGVCSKRSYGGIQERAPSPRERLFVLQDLTNGFIHRRDYSCLKGFLPSIYDYAIFVPLTLRQRKEYNGFLQQIQADDEEDDDIIKDEGNDSSDDDSDGDDDDNSIWNLDQNINQKAAATATATTITTTTNPRGSSSKSRVVPPSSSSLAGCTREDVERKKREEAASCGSGKLAIATEIARAVRGYGEKIIIFSQRLRALDLLERHLDAVLGLAPGQGTLRFDGATNGAKRQELIDVFNDTDSEACVLFCSTRAGCLGTNITGANHVLLFDVSWNPSQDIQALHRAYRIGQTKTVYVYRLVSTCSLEEMVYRMQIEKRRLADCVIDGTRNLSDSSPQPTESQTTGTGIAKNALTLTEQLSAKQRYLKERFKLSRSTKKYRKNRSKGRRKRGLIRKGTKQHSSSMKNRRVIRRSGLAEVLATTLEEHHRENAQ
eukprot:jgi/Bigna1/71661/fgenesh1_pg.16_\